MRKKLMVLTALFGTVSFGATMSLDMVLGELKKNNALIRSGELEVESKKLDEKRAFKLLLPGANFEIDKEIINNEQYKDGAGVFGPQVIKMPINVYSGGKLVNNYKKIKADTKIAESNLNLTYSDEELKAIDLYFEILNLQKQMEITKATKDVLMKQENRLSILYSNNKMVSKNELLEVKADIMSIDAEMLRYINSTKFAKEKLGKLMGTSGEFSVAEYSQKFGARDLATDRVVARDENSTIKRKALEVEKADLDVKIAKAGYLPTISITPEYRLDKDIQRGNNKEWGVQLEAKINVFQWGATMDDVDSKKMARDRKEIEKQDTIRGVEINLNSKYREIELLTEELNIARERVNILEENSKIQNIRFSNGLISSLDYLESVQLLRRAEENRYAVEKSLIFANKQYESLLK